jgi:16S rRNA processing protein RimM
MPPRRRAPLPKGPPPAAGRTRAQRRAIAGNKVPQEARPAAAPPTASAPRRRPQREPAAGFVAVGLVLAPFGLKGELKVQSLSENPDRLRAGAVVYAGRERVTVARSREAQGYTYLSLRGHPDRTSVERFRHSLLQVPESELPKLPAGEYYRFQLIGLAVVDRDGVALGTLDEVLETGANDVYRVRTPDGRDVLLPAVPDVIVEVDLAARRITVDPPEWR